MTARPLALPALLAVLALTLAACGGPPPTLGQQRAAIAFEPTPVGKARAGWWAWLDGDRAAAAAAFEAAGDVPLAALGRARLAADALDDARALTEGARAANGEGRVALLGAALARRAAGHLRDGPEQLADALGPAAERRVRLDDARWTVRVSFLPFLDRPRLIAAPPAADAPDAPEGDPDDLARVKVLGKWWALSESAPDPDPDGVVITRWALDPGPAHIELRVDGPALVWRDGALVAATPEGAHPPGRLRFTAPGDGPLWLAWSAGRLPRAWRLDRPAPADPDPTARIGGGPDWLARALAAWQALSDRNPSAAARWLDGAPATAAFSLLRARLAELQEGLPGTVRRDRARAAWTAGLPLAPGAARLALAELARRGGDVDGAAEHLDVAQRGAPQSWPAHRARVRLLLNQGRIDEARRAIDAAERVAPDPCDLLDDRAALRGDRPAGRDDPLVAAFDACERPLDAIDRLLSLHRPAEALIRLEAMGDDSDAARRLHARTLVALGRLDDAARRLPDATVDDTLTAADLTLAADPEDEADGALEAAMRRLMADHPTAREALTVLAAWPEWSLFADVRRQTEAVIGTWEDSVPLPGPAVRVLDHSALVYFADGTRLRWVHEVLAIRSREAAEEFGELSLPGDEVVPIAIYTRKADGRRLYAEEVPEKESLSLPDLADGDYVVAVYLEPGDNGYLYDAGYLTPRVYFRGVDMPIFDQRFEVYSPDDTPPDHQRLEGAPAPMPVTLAGRAGLRFDARGVPVRTPESDPVPAGLWLPSIRAGRNVKLEEDLAYYRDRVLALRRRTAEFDDWARDIAGEGDARARIRRLARAVRADVGGDVGLIRRSAAPALHDGQGNRALVLSAMLEAAGIGHRLVLARPKVRVPAGPFMQVADYPYALIAVDDGPWIDPGPDRAAVGWIPHLMLGGDGLVVWPPQHPVDPVPLPTARSMTDKRRVHVEAHWDAAGVVRGVVVDRLWGQEASVIGRYLAQLDPEMRPRLVERLLLHAFPAGRVIDFADPIAADASPDGPLELRYTFEADVGDSLRLGTFPVQPGRRYGHEQTRTIPLSIDLPTNQRVHIELTSDRDFGAKARTGARVEGPYSYRIALDADDDEIELEAELQIAGGPVRPADYPAFAEWARAVDGMERLTLTVHATEAAEAADTARMPAEAASGPSVVSSTGPRESQPAAAR